MFYVTLQDHVIKGLCDFMEKIPHCICLLFLICHKISQDHRTKKHPNIMSMSPLRLVTLLLSLTAMDTAVVEMYNF